MDDHYLEWLNCSCPENKVNSITELSDGVIFLQLLDKIGYKYKCSNENNSKIISQFIKEKFPDYDIDETTWLQRSEELKYASLLFLIYIALKHEDTQLRNAFSNNLSTSSQLFIKEFLEEVLESQQNVTKSVIINATKKFDKSEPSSDDAAFYEKFTRTPCEFTTPARSKRRTSALQDFFQSPNTLKKILDEKNLEQKRLKNELDNEMSEKLDLMQRVEDNEKLIQKLDKQLLLKTAETKKLKDEIQELQYQLNDNILSNSVLEMKDVDLEKTAAKVKELEKYVTEQENYVSVLEKDIIGLKEESSAYQKQIHVLSELETTLKEENHVLRHSHLECENKCKSLENTLSNLESKFTLVNELYQELQAENEQLKADSLIKDSGLTLEMELEIQQNERLKEELARLSDEHVAVVKSYEEFKTQKNECIERMQEDNDRYKKELENDLDELRTRNRALSSNLDEIKVENGSLRRDLEDTSKLLQASRSSENNYRKLVENLQTDKDELECRCLNYERIIREVSDDCDKINGEYQRIKVDMTELRAENERLEAELETSSKHLRLQIAHLENQLADEALQRDSDARRMYEERDNAIADMENKLRLVELTNEELNETVEKLTSERDKLKTDCFDKQARIDDLEAKANEMKLLYSEVAELKSVSEKHLKLTVYLKSKLKSLRDEVNSNLGNKLDQFIDRFQYVSRDFSDMKETSNERIRYATQLETGNEDLRNRLNRNMDEIKRLTDRVSDAEKTFQLAANKFEREIKQTEKMFEKSARKYRSEIRTLVETVGRLERANVDINVRNDRLNDMHTEKQVACKELQDKIRTMELADKSKTEAYECKIRCLETEMKCAIERNVHSDSHQTESILEEEKLMNEMKEVCKKLNVLEIKFESFIGDYYASNLNNAYLSDGDDDDDHRLHQVGNNILYPVDNGNSSHHDDNGNSSHHDDNGNNSHHDDNGNNSHHDDCYIQNILNGIILSASAMKSMNRRLDRLIQLTDNLQAFNGGALKIRSDGRDEDINSEIERLKIKCHDELDVLHLSNRELKERFEELSNSLTTEDGGTVVLCSPRKDVITTPDRESLLKKRVSELTGENERLEKDLLAGKMCFDSFKHALTDMEELLNNKLGIIENDKRELQTIYSENVEKYRKDMDELKSSLDSSNRKVREQICKINSLENVNTEYKLAKHNQINKLHDKEALKCLIRDWMNFIVENSGLAAEYERSYDETSIIGLINALETIYRLFKDQTVRMQSMKNENDGLIRLVNKLEENKKKIHNKNGTELLTVEYADKMRFNENGVVLQNNNEADSAEKRSSMNREKKILSNDENSLAAKIRINSRETEIDRLNISPLKMVEQERLKAEQLQSQLKQALENNGNLQNELNKVTERLNATTSRADKLVRESMELKWQKSQLTNQLQMKENIIDGVRRDIDNFKSNQQPEASTGNELCGGSLITEQLQSLKEENERLKVENESLGDDLKSKLDRISQLTERMKEIEQNHTARMKEIERNHTARMKEIERNHTAELETIRRGAQIEIERDDGKNNFIRHLSVKLAAVNNNEVKNSEEDICRRVDELIENNRTAAEELKEKAKEIEEMKRKMLMLYDDVQAGEMTPQKKRRRSDKIWRNNILQQQQFEIGYNNLRNVIKESIAGVRSENESLQKALNEEIEKVKTVERKCIRVKEDLINEITYHQKQISELERSLEQSRAESGVEISRLSSELIATGAEVERLKTDSERTTSNSESERMNNLKCIDRLTLELNRLKEKFQMESDKVRKLQEENRNLTERIRTDENRMVNANDQLTTSRNENSNLAKRIEVLETTKNERKHRNDLVDTTVKSLENRLRQSEQEIERMKNSNNRLTSEKLSLTKELEDKKKTVESLQSRTIKLERNLADKLEQLNKFNNKHHEKDRNDKNTAVEYEQNVNRLTNELNRVTQDTVKLTKENNNLKELNRTVNVDKQELQKSLKMMTESTDKLKSELNRCREKTTKAEKCKQEIETKITEMYSKLQEEILQLVEADSRDDSTKLSSSVEGELQPEIMINRLKDLVSKAAKKETELTDKKMNKLRDQVVEKVRLEYEGKLERAKDELKKVFMQQQQELSDRWIKKENDYKMQIHKQKEHIESLSSQFWDISDKYLRLQQANNKRDTLLSSVINKDSLATDDGRNTASSSTTLMKSKSVSNLTTLDSAKEPCLSRFSDFFESNAAKQMRSKKQQPSTTIGKVFPTADEVNEVFDNAALAEITGEKQPKTDLLSENAVDAKRLSVLQERNSLYKPHLRSCYPLETQFVPPSVLKEDEIKMGFSNNIDIENIPPSEKRYRKNRNQTSYKKPGPPTPNKNSGRLTQQGVNNDTPSRNMLREFNMAGGNGTKRKSFTPSRLLNNIFGTRGPVPLSSTASQNENQQTVGTPLSKFQSIRKRFSKHPDDDTNGNNYSTFM